MRKLSFIAILTLLLQTPVPQSAAGTTFRSIQDDRKDSIQTVRDTFVVVNDTLQEIKVKAKKELPVADAIGKSLGNAPKQPRSKGISDIIGAKANDKIMYPFAWKERRKEKNKKRTQQTIKKLETAKSYEDELTEAINRQLREDSIAEAKKRQQQPHITDTH